MRVLSIDTDFFLDNLTTVGAPTGSRLPLETHKPWISHDVRRFLAETLLLPEGVHVPGWAVDSHDDLFRRWHAAILAGTLTVPFDLVHVDAHSDLGVDVAGSRHFVATELLDLPLEERVAACLPRLVQGNFVLLALACRWLSSFTFIRHPNWVGDYPDEVIVWKNDRAAGLKARKIGAAEWSSTLMTHCYPAIQPEPTIPLFTHDPQTAPPQGGWDFIGVARSPRFTPAAADKVFRLLRSHVAPSGAA